MLDYDSSNFVLIQGKMAPIVETQTGNTHESVALLAIIHSEYTILDSPYRAIEPEVANKSSGQIYHARGKSPNPWDIIHGNGRI